VYLKIFPPPQKKKTLFGGEGIFILSGFQGQTNFDGGNKK